jgi:hypothetical protein
MKGIELPRRERTKRREILLIMIQSQNQGSGIRFVIIETEAVSSRQSLGLGYWRDIGNEHRGRHILLRICRQIKLRI